MNSPVAGGGPEAPRETAPHPDEVLLDGPWNHKLVHVRGQRLHVAECGAASDPLVLLLHGVAGGWFDWRLVLESLADAPVHAVAVSGRGYGTSDRTPGGYSPMKAAADAAGLVRALGHSDALVVGQGLGALTAWTMAARHPGLVRGLVVGGMIHPVVWSRASRRRPFSAPMRATWGSFARYATVLGSIGRDGRSAARIARDTYALTGPGFADTQLGVESARLTRRALEAGSLDAALQHMAFLGSPLSAGRRRWLAELRKAGIPASRMFIGAADPMWSRRMLAASTTGGIGPEVLPGVGCLPSLEAPAQVTEIIRAGIRDAYGV